MRNIVGLLSLIVTLSARAEVQGVVLKDIPLREGAIAQVRENSQPCTMVGRVQHTSAITTRPIRNGAMWSISFNKLACDREDGTRVEMIIEGGWLLLDKAVPAGQEVTVL